MRYSREEFNAMKPMSKVVLQVDGLVKEKEGSIYVPSVDTSKKDFATHKGIVVKEPIKKHYPPTQPPQVFHGTEYEIRLGDTVYFAWEAFNLSKDKEAMEFIEVDDDTYIAIDYRDLMLCERGEEKFGLNGWCAGYYPERKVKQSLIYIPTESMEKEIHDAVNSRAKMIDDHPMQNDRIVVTHAPKSYVTWDLGEIINQTKVKVGDIVMFPPYSFAIPLTSSKNVGDELYAINTREICAYEQ